MQKWKRPQSPKTTTKPELPLCFNAEAVTARFNADSLVPATQSL